MRTWGWMLILPIVGMLGQLPIEPVIQMALIAVSIFLVVKTQTLMTYQTCERRIPLTTAMAWFILWPGLNPGPFFELNSHLPRPGLDRWALAFAKTALGLTLFFILAPQLVAWNRMVAGWVAMAGILFVFHFGLFEISALAWRQVGRDVSPIMNSPLLATSLSEFWNQRWNIAFRDFAFLHVFRPLAKRFRPKIATWGCFLFSGLVHELAISVPAHAGFGLPMSYFLLQGVGIATEREAYRKGWWRRNSVCGWLFVVLLTVPAAYYLFHPPFIQSVILPLIEK